jgi:hypothetical protein
VCLHFTSDSDNFVSITYLHSDLITLRRRGTFNAVLVVTLCLLSSSIVEMHCILLLYVNVEQQLTTLSVCMSTQGWQMNILDMFVFMHCACLIRICRVLYVNVAILANLRTIGNYLLIVGLWINLIPWVGETKLSQKNRLFSHLLIFFFSWFYRDKNARCTRCRPFTKTTIQ